MKSLNWLTYSIFLFLSISGNAQVYQGSEAEKRINHAKKIWVDSPTHNIKYIEFPNKTQSIYRSKDWIKENLDISGQIELKEISTFVQGNGVKHVKYQIYYGDIPVEGSVLNVQSEDNFIKRLHGDHLIPKEINTVPSLSESAALTLARRYVGAKQYHSDYNKAYSSKAELVILPIERIFHLAYKFDIYAYEPFLRQYIYVDAQSGEILKSIDRLHTKSYTGVANTMYHGVQEIETKFNDDGYSLSDVSRGNGITTLNMHSSTMFSNASPFFDHDNYWEADSNRDEAATNAHYAMQKTYDYFKHTFGRNSFDGQGTEIISYVHFHKDYNNAFWDGATFVFGDGDGINYAPMTSTDVVAHEYTHAITQYTAGLEYANESGALNESFSDIFGVVVDFYCNPNSANFMLGEEYSIKGLPKRNMANPKQTHNPDTYMGEYWVTDEHDHGGIHSNNGVQNYWFYLLAMGGEGQNDNKAFYKLDGIGIEKAAEIAYRNLTIYLTPYSQYEDARFYSIQSAIDLFGENSKEVIAVTNAWYAVGVGEAYPGPKSEIEVHYFSYLGETLIGKNLTDTAYVVNTGESVLTVSDVLLNSDLFVLNLEHDSIQTGDSVRLFIQYLPEESGIDSLSFTIRSNAGNDSVLTASIWAEAKLPSAPAIKTNLETVLLAMHDNDFELQLDQIFADPQKDKLYYDVIYSDHGVVNADIGQELVVFQPMNSGEVNIEIKAFNSWGLSSSVFFKIIVLETTDLEVNSEPTEVQLYPNPTKGNITIELSNLGSGNIMVNLVSLSGQLIFQELYSEDQTSVSLTRNLSSLPNGMYRLTVTDNQRTYSTNLIKN